MRIPITIAILLILLLGGSYASSRFIEATTLTLDTQLDTVEQAISDQKWEVSLDALNKAQQRWDKSKSWLTILLDHQELDDIDVSIERLNKYIEAQSLALSLGELSTLRLQVGHISDSEQLTVRNIF